MTSQSPDAPTLAALAARLQRVEDVLAVHRVLVTYGLAADAGDADGVAALYAEDCVVDIDADLRFEGRQAVHDMILGDGHQALVGRCAHVMGPFSVTVEGDLAQATGYASLLVSGQEGVEHLRQAFGRFELERRGGEWQIVRRTSRALGSPELADVLRPAADGGHSEVSA